MVTEDHIYLNKLVNLAAGLFKHEWNWNTRYFWYSKNAILMNLAKQTQKSEHTQRLFTSLKLAMKALEQGVQSVQSWHKKTPERPHIDVALTYLLLTFKRFHAFSLYFIFEFGEVLPVEFAGVIKVQTGKNNETYKYACKLCHINQTDQTTTWKETCIEFKMYAECRLWANITKFIEILAPKE